MKVGECVLIRPKCLLHFVGGETGGNGTRKPLKAFTHCPSLLTCCSSPSCTCLISVILCLCTDSLTPPPRALRPTLPLSFQHFPIAPPPQSPRVCFLFLPMKNLVRSIEQSNKQQ